MLLELSVRAYALLDSVHVSFNNGFTVLTGETGAGKSLLIKAVGLILGEKGDINSIRMGNEEADVSATLSIKKESEAYAWLKQKDISIDDDQVIIRRTLKRSGKSSIFINGYTVSREELVELSNYLFDMHGQHEHQSLYHKENHRKILDKNALNHEIMAKYHNLYTQFKQKKEALQELRNQQAKNQEQLEFYNFAFKEIEEVWLEASERESLIHKLKIAEQSEKIAKDLNSFAGLTTAAGSSIMQLKEALTYAKKLDDILDNDLIKRYESAMLELEDAALSVVENRNKYYFNENELGSMQQKLSRLQAVEKKYGSGSYEKLSSFKEEIETKLSLVNQAGDAEYDLKKQLKELEAAILEQAKAISLLRQEKALLLSSQIEESLSALEMKNCRFSIIIKNKTNTEGHLLIGPYGIDDVEFFFEPNLGGGNRPIKDIASGGEASRIMLALKSVLATSDEIETIIFDEIDTGIGGGAAAAVAKHIAKLGNNKQILVITHLASIASLANSHLKIEKQSSLDSTQTFIRPLNSNDRVDEIARMLAGKVDDISREHANSLLNQKI